MAKAVVAEVNISAIDVVCCDGDPLVDKTQAETLVKCLNATMHGDVPTRRGHMGDSYGPEFYKEEFKWMLNLVLLKPDLDVVAGAGSSPRLR